MKKLMSVLMLGLVSMMANAQNMHFDNITCVNSATNEQTAVSLNFRVASRGSQDQLEVQIDNYPDYEKPVVLNFCKLPYAGDSRLMRLESGVWCLTSTIKREMTYLLIGSIENTETAYTAIQIEYREKNKKIDKYPCNLIVTREQAERIHEFLTECLVDGVLEEKRM